MLEKEELQRLRTTQLAVLCGRVAESPITSSLKADQARDLKDEWALLVAYVTPAGSLRIVHDYDSKIDRLRYKMLSFLSLPKLPR
jgi:hypothetical protein